MIVSGVLAVSGTAFASGSGGAFLSMNSRGPVWSDLVEQMGNASQTDNGSSADASAQVGEAAAADASVDGSAADGSAADTAEASGVTEAAGDTSASDNSEAAAPDNSGAASATVMIYLNGSDLESSTGAASSDIAEMLEAGCGENVNVVLETLGTRKWHDYGISADTAQRWRVNGSQLELVQDGLGQLDTTAQETLSDFVGWAASAYPADRYILMLWDHGGGAVYGYGYDEWQSEEASLTIDEIRNALEANSGVHFDFIGMDACLMSSLEVCMVLAPYCDYTVLSEDFESNIGWYYTDWLQTLENNPGIGSVELGKVIVDTMLAANKADTSLGGDATLAMIDESRVADLFVAWTNFAYANEDLLLGSNYSTKRRSKGRVLPQLEDTVRAKAEKEQAEESPELLRKRYDGGYSYSNEDNAHYSEYYVTDIMAVASNASGEGTAELENAVSGAIAYMDSSSSETLTGIGVTLPYGDNYFYEELQKVFTNCALDSAYIEWLQKFVYADGSGSYYDYDQWYENWGGWSSWYAQVSGQGSGADQESSPDDGYYDDYYDDSSGDGYYDDGAYDDGYYDDGTYDDGYCEDGTCDEGYYDDSSPEGSGGGGWYESLYNTYGENGESYDTWYDEWYDEWSGHRS